VGIGFYMLMVFNVLWFIAVQGSREGFMNEWACTKCGEVWDPTKPEEESIEGSKVA
jgi:hypothetical protein